MTEFNLQEETASCYRDLRAALLQSASVHMDCAKTFRDDRYRDVAITALHVASELKRT